MQSASNIAPVKHALLGRDETEHLIRLLGDQLGVAPACCLVEPSPRYLHPLALHLRGVNAHMLGRLDRKPARQVRAMIDPHIQPGPRQVLVRHALPRLPKVADLHVSRGEALRQEPLVLPLQKRLLSQPFGRHHPRRHHHMRMMVADVTRLVRRMDRKIHRRPVTGRQLPRKVPAELQTLFARQLVRQGDLEFPRHTRVLALLGELGGIPQRRPVLRPIRRHTVRKHDLRILHPFFPGEVMRQAIAFVGQPFGGAIGGRGDGAATARPRDHLAAEMIDRQTDHAPNQMQGTKH